MLHEEFEQGEKATKWYRSPIDKIKLHQLKQRSDLQGLFYIFLHFIILAITALSTYYFYNKHQWFLAAVLLFAHGTFYSFLGMAGLQHELIHKTVFKSRFLNDFFLRLCSFLTWNNYFYYQLSHIQHHQNTLYKDLDREVVLPQSFNSLSVIMALTIDFFGIYRAIKITLENSFNIIRGSWGNKLFPKSNSKKRKQLFGWARLVIIGHSLIIILSIYFGHWPIIALTTFAPFIATWLNKLLALAQHMGMECEISDYRRNSRTIILNPFFAFLYWQMNYHIEHHMYPGVPFFNLKKLRKLIEFDLPPANLGVLSTWKSLLKINKEQKI